MHIPVSLPPVDVEEFGFSIHRRQAVVMQRAHRHNDLEVLVVEGGSVTWMFGGTRVEVPKDRLAVRWAAVPHRCINFVGRASHVSLKLPLAWLLSWQLCQPFVERLFKGHHVIDEPSPGATSDAKLMRQWMRDLKAGGAERQRIVLLELEARLRRLAVAVETRAKSAGRKDSLDSAPAVEIGKVEQMAAFISQHYSEMLRMSDIAESVGLHPRYAMSIFHKAFGMTMLDFVTHFRVWHAQRLLASTDAKIVQIAYDSGFGSASRFYAAFEQIVGHSPKEYRRNVRGNR